MVEEIIAVMRAARERADGARLRALFVGALTEILRRTANQDSHNMTSTVDGCGCRSWPTRLEERPA
ncbi:MAG: hypothetical protein WBP81_31730 [Solirubrobacteraceae bacterium]